MRASRVRRMARSRARGQELGFDQHGNDRAGAEGERLVAQDAEDGADLARVRGNGDPGVVVGAED